MLPRVGQGRQVRLWGQIGRSLQRSVAPDIHGVCVGQVVTMVMQRRQVVKRRRRWYVTIGEGVVWSDPRWYGRQGRLGVARQQVWVKVHLGVLVIGCSYNKHTTTLLD